MRIVHASETAAIDRLTTRDRSRDPRVERQTARIVEDVRRRGDAALERWMRALDGIAPPFEITARELRAGWAKTPAGIRRALALAARHVQIVAERQVPRGFTVQVCPGVRIEQRVAPLARVGCYVPGGRYPLPSTLLMTVIPARVAGVADITVACPRPAPVVLAAALEAGATRVLRIGGAQAIAALAYGTSSIQAVDKIVGPGNAWVAAAKARVSADCAIDFRAGPSEIVICSDAGSAEWIAADLLAQAEHDPDARAIAVTTRPALANAIAAALTRRAGASGAAATRIPTKNVSIVLARDRVEAAAFVARLAPEHLVCDRPADSERLGPAGSVFVGDWSAQAAGDYCTGSNHVLPTGGAARVRGGLGAADFVRVFTVQHITRRGLGTIGPWAATLATAEGLHAHADSIRMRLESTRPRPSTAAHRRQSR